MSLLANIRRYYEHSFDVHARSAKFLLAIIDEQEKALKHADDMAFYVQTVQSDEMLRDMGLQYETARGSVRKLANKVGLVGQ